MKRDRGAAALELALVTTVLFALMAFTAPLAKLVQTKISLQRVAGSSARFATSVKANTVRYAVAGRRPTILEVVQKTTADWQALVGAGASPISIVLSKDPSAAHAGEQVEVTASTTVDLGLFGDAMSLFNMTGGSTVTVTANAVGRQE